MRWLALAMIGCTSEGTVVARTWDGDFLIDSIVITCDAVAWTYDVWTLGWGDVITVDVVLRSGGSLLLRENHVLPEVDYGDDWAWHQVELEMRRPYATSQDERVTDLPCPDKTFVTYGFASWRYDGEMQECVAWGVDPQGEFPQCADWGATGHGEP